MVVAKAELAQSYIFQANNSLRCGGQDLIIFLSPRRPCRGHNFKNADFDDKVKE
jgi:hypothetical protein